jgi:hypothetical protein
MSAVALELGVEVEQLEQAHAGQLTRELRHLAERGADGDQQLRESAAAGGTLGDPTFGVAL